MKTKSLPMFAAMKSLLLGLVVLVTSSDCAATDTTVTRSSPEGRSCIRLSSLDASGGVTTATTERPAKVKILFQASDCNGNHITDLKSENFSVREDGSAISGYESNICILRSAQRFKSHLMLVLDISGSMTKSNSLDALKHAVKALVKNVLEEEAQGRDVTIFAFDGRELLIHVTDGASSDVNAINNLITDINCDGTRYCADESTNLNGAFISAMQKMDAIIQADSDVRYKLGSIVLFTDGTDQAGRASKEDALKQLGNSPHNIFTVGLGGEIDQATLLAFARNQSSNFVRAAQASELEAAFRLIEKKYRDTALSYYALEYCSPKRQGEHTLELLAASPAYGCGSLKSTFSAQDFVGGCATACGNQVQQKIPEFDRLCAQQPAALPVPNVLATDKGAYRTFGYLALTFGIAAAIAAPILAWQSQEQFSRITSGGLPNANAVVGALNQGNALLTSAIISGAVGGGLTLLGIPLLVKGYQKRAH